MTNGSGKNCRIKQDRKRTMKTNKWLWALLAILLGVGMGTAGAATNEAGALLQQGLFEEEANQNLDAAIQAYQAVVAQTEKNRQFAATAVFRLGECYRKEGKTNEAVAQYQRVLREFTDQTQLATLSRQNLAGMGVSAAGPPTQEQLIEQAIKLLEQQVQSQQTRVNQGVLSPDELATTQRTLLEYKRQLAALEAGQPLSAAAPAAPEADEEDKAIQRIQSMMQNTPDLITGSANELISAAEKGQLRVAAFLLDHGANVNGYPGPARPLIHAARLAQKTMVELLLNRGADVNARDNDNDTALSVAVEFGYKSVVEVLLAHKADVNLKAQSGWMPLHMAAEKGYADIAGLLITNGADVNALDDHGETPLYQATSTGNTALMQLLMDHRAAVNIRDNDGYTPLHIACNFARINAALLLLKNGADVSAKEEKNGWMPLHIAVDKQQPELVKLLLENHADPNARISSYQMQRQGTQFGERPDVTPLIMAAMNPNAEIVRLLVEHKADVNARDADGDTPLILVVRKPGSPVVGRIIPDGLKERLTIAGLLLDNGADVNAQNNNKQSALGQAVADNSAEMVKLLLAHKPQVDVLYYNGWTLLQWAVSEQQVEIAGLLLDAGADLNFKYPADANNRWVAGLTPLTLAVARENKDLVAVLLAHHADPNAPDDSHQTPLSLAKSHQNDASDQRPLQVAAIIDLLLKAGANENLHRLSVIRASRPGNMRTVFTKTPDVPNHFTLLDLVAQYYAPPYHGQSIGPVDLGQLPGFLFPDFARVAISRLQKDGRTNVIRVDLQSVFESGDCSKDVPLEWGDIVEIPEADHNVNDIWPGLSDEARATLRKCVAAQVEILVKGRTNLMTLRPLIYRDGHPSNVGGIYLTTGESSDIKINGFEYTVMNKKDHAKQSSFWLHDVVYNANVILTSSDLSRVKVIRKDPATRKTIELTLDLEKNDPANALWLRDGDVIEIPEKP